MKYDGFTDIEFNPEKSINCQARAAALFVSLSRRGLLELAMTSIDNYIKIITNRTNDSINKKVEQVSFIL